MFIALFFLMCILEPQEQRNGQATSGGDKLVNSDFNCEGTKNWRRTSGGDNEKINILSPPEVRDKEKINCLSSVGLERVLRQVSL